MLKSIKIKKKVKEIFARIKDNIYLCNVKQTERPHNIGDKR